MAAKVCKMSEITKQFDESLVEKARAVFDEVPYLKLLGMELVEMKAGEATVRLAMRDGLRQPHGLLHGGATASVIDTATAFAVVSVLEPNEKASTVDLTVHYLRPVADGAIVCRAKVVRAGRRLLTVSAEAENEEGKLIATALSTYSKV